MKVGEVAAASGCHVETIRYYERVGLLPEPARTASGYRAYTTRDVERLRFISRGRELGFGLDKIRSLLRLSDEPNIECDEVDRIARAHLADIQDRIGQLERMATELNHVIASCGGGKRRGCLILGTLRGQTRQNVLAAQQP